MLRLRQAARFPCQLRLQHVKFVNIPTVGLSQPCDSLWGRGFASPPGVGAAGETAKRAGIASPAAICLWFFENARRKLCKKAAHFLALNQFASGNMARVRRACRPAGLFRQAGRSSGSGSADFATHGFIICKHFSKTAQTKGRYNTATAKRGQAAPWQRAAFRQCASPQAGHTLYPGAAENGNFLDGGRSVPDVLRPRGCGACGKRGAGLAQMTRNTAKALGRTDAMRRRGALGAQGVDS